MSRFSYHLISFFFSSTLLNSSSFFLLLHLPSLFVFTSLMPPHAPSLIYLISLTPLLSYFLSSFSLIFACSFPSRVLHPPSFTHLSLFSFALFLSPLRRSCSSRVLCVFLRSLNPSFSFLLSHFPFFILLHLPSLFLSSLTLLARPVYHPFHHPHPPSINLPSFVSSFSLLLPSLRVPSAFLRLPEDTGATANPFPLACLCDVLLRPFDVPSGFALCGGI